MALLRDMTGAQQEVLKGLFILGPLWDGNVPSKSGRDELVRMGLVEHRNGWAFLTAAGVAVCTSDETRSAVRGWGDQRWNQKLRDS